MNLEVWEEIAREWWRCKESNLDDCVESAAVKSSEINAPGQTVGLTCVLRDLSDAEVNVCCMLRYLEVNVREQVRHGRHIFVYNAAPTLCNNTKLAGIMN